MSKLTDAAAKIISFEEAYVAARKDAESAVDFAAKALTDAARASEKERKAKQALDNAKLDLISAAAA